MASYQSDLPVGGGASTNGSDHEFDSGSDFQNILRFMSPNGLKIYDPEDIATAFATLETLREEIQRDLDQETEEPHEIKTSVEDASVHIDSEIHERGNAQLGDEQQDADMHLHQVNEHQQPDTYQSEGSEEEEEECMEREYGQCYDPDHYRQHLSEKWEAQESDEDYYADDEEPDDGNFGHDDYRYDDYGDDYFDY